MPSTTRQRPGAFWKAWRHARFRRFPANMTGLRKIAPLATALLLLAGCRQDMHNQPRFKPMAKSDFYADMRSARAPVEGTVAHGELRADSYFDRVMIPDKNILRFYIMFM